MDVISGFEMNGFTEMGGELGGQRPPALYAPPPEKQSLGPKYPNGGGVWGGGLICICGAAAIVNFGLLAKRTK